MLVAAAVCPHPPILVPQLAAGAAPELDECRAACALAIDRLLAVGPDLLVLVGVGCQTRRHPQSATGSLAPYGVPAKPAPTRPPTLPLSLTIGRWLLRQRPTPPIGLQELSADATPEECARSGAELAAGAARVGLLVLADGSGYRLQTPVGDDGRGDAFDDAVVAALCAGDTDTLLALAPAGDGPLWTTGRPALQALAGALGDPLRGRLLWRGAPYGVGYFVISLSECTLDA